MAQWLKGWIAVAEDTAQLPVSSTLGINTFNCNSREFNTLFRTPWPSVLTEAYIHAYTHAHTHTHLCIIKIQINL